MRITAPAPTHDELSGVSADQHHAQDHEARHRAGGADALAHNNQDNPSEAAHGLATGEHVLGTNSAGRIVQAGVVAFASATTYDVTHTYPTALAAAPAVATGQRCNTAARRVTQHAIITVSTTAATERGSLDAADAGSIHFVEVEL